MDDLDSGDVYRLVSGVIEFAVGAAFPAVAGKSSTDIVGFARVMGLLMDIPVVATPGSKLRVIDDHIGLKG